MNRDGAPPRQRPIRVRTIGDLTEHDCLLFARCNACQHVSRLDLKDLRRL
jgi:hypothetical protein